MGRTLRTNSASGGNSSSGLSLSDIETAYDIPKLLQTIDITSDTTFLDIPSLDTTAYERIYILMSCFACTANNYIQFGGMSNNVRFDNENRYSYGGTQGASARNQRGSNGNCYTNAQTAHTYAASTPNGNTSNTMVEWNFFFPEPTSTTTKITGNFNWMGGDYDNNTQNCYGNFMIQKMDQSTHANGLFFKMGSGTFRKSAHTFRTTVYGYKRRPAPAT